MYVMLTELTNNIIESFEERGLPETYPIPHSDGDLLFYIQRNQNQNTVIYELNYNDSGQVNRQFPIKVYWIKYLQNSKIESLNYIQNKLAYGYQSEEISKDLFKFNLVSYDKLSFFLDLSSDVPLVVANISNQNVIISNIYVYADEIGIFPQVKYIEFYGLRQKDQQAFYKKITFGSGEVVI